MPFLGKDWRSCGDRWIRTENGWERSKVLECILDNLSIGLRRENIKNKHKSFMSERNKRINSECCECGDEDACSSSSVSASGHKHTVNSGKQQENSDSTLKDDENNITSSSSASDDAISESNVKISNTNPASMTEYKI